MWVGDNEQVEHSVKGSQLGVIVCCLQTLMQDKTYMYVYPYIQHLLEFEQKTGNWPVPGWLKEVATPLVWREWQQELLEHPDQAFKDYVLIGIWNGFRSHI